MTGWHNFELNLKPKWQNYLFLTERCVPFTRTLIVLVKDFGTTLVSLWAAVSRENIFIAYENPTHTENIVLIKD